MWLQGTEALTIELGGDLPEHAADALAAKLPDGLALEREITRWGRFSVVIIDMHGLGADLPWPAQSPRADYREILYRVSARYEGTSAWLVLRCDLDRRLVRGLAARLIRYPVAAAAISIHDEERKVAVEATAVGARLAVAVTAHETRLPAVEEPRRTFVVDNRTLYEIPWQERPTPRRQSALVEEIDLTACAAVFGTKVHVDARATIHRGRIHRCARARRCSAGDAQS